MLARRWRVSLNLKMKRNSLNCEELEKLTNIFFIFSTDFNKTP